MLCYARLRTIGVRAIAHGASAIQEDRRTTAAANASSAPVVGCDVRAGFPGDAISSRSVGMRGLTLPVFLTSTSRGGLDEDR